MKDRTIFIKNIYYMLSYAFTTLNQAGYEDIAPEAFENIHNLFAAILAKGIGRQLKQGLYRSYLNRKDTLSGVRGKIDLPETLQNCLGRKRVLTCEYDELSENNLLSQILKTTALLLQRHGQVNSKFKSDLKKEMLLFRMSTSSIRVRFAGLLFGFSGTTAPIACSSACASWFWKECC